MYTLAVLSLLVALQASLVGACSGASLDGQVPFEARPTKRIAIVGAGAAGIATLKAIMDLDEEVRRGWDVVAFEEREGVGGLWYAYLIPIIFNWMLKKSRLL